MAEGSVRRHNELANCLITGSRFRNFLERAHASILTHMTVELSNPKKMTGMSSGRDSSWVLSWGVRASTVAWVIFQPPAASASSKLPVAGITSALQLSGLCPSSLIRVNPLAYSLCSVVNKVAESVTLSPAIGRGINTWNRVWNWVAKLHRLAGRYDNPMPTWFLAPRLKLPTQYSRQADKLESICWRNDSELLKEWVTNLVKTT